MKEISEANFVSNKNRIFYRFRKSKSDTYLAILHGYPTSSEDYMHLLSSIPEKYGVIVHDHLGFGKSSKPLNSEYLLTEQADLALELYNHLNIQKVHLVAHDYGTSVATEIIARDNNQELDILIESFTLCNGSMLIDMSQLRLIQKLLKNRLTGSLVAKLSSARTFHRNMKNIWFDKSLYVKDDMQVHWDLLKSGNGKNVLPKVTRYIDQRYQNYDRWIGALKSSKKPFHILWAENDPVAVIDMAYKLESMIANVKLTVMTKCGHYPMIEKGEEWLKELLVFTSKINSPK